MYLAFVLQAWLAASATAAAAQFSIARHRLGEAVDVQLLGGYPRAADPYGGTFTLGLQLHNRAQKRRIRVELTGAWRQSRSVELPASAGLRLFFYLPNLDPWEGRLQLQLTDLASGERLSITGLDIPPVWKHAEPVAQLYPVSTPLFMSAPLASAGALDDHVPDDWRGLSGVRAIVGEQQVAFARSTDWPVLIDWVAMGGVLVLAAPPEQFDTPVPWQQPPFASAWRHTAAGSIQDVGFGAIARVAPERLSSMDRQFVADADVPCQWSVEPINPTSLLGEAFWSLHDAVQHPDWRLFDVLFTFVIVGGPLGWWLFICRRRRPMLYLAFVLLCSGGCSVLMLWVDAAANGVHPRASVRSMRFIDQTVGRELRFEEVAIQAPFESGTQLRLPRAAQLFLGIEPRLASGDGLEVIERGKRQWLHGAIEPHRRELIGSRSIEAAQGRLRITHVEQELELDNELGVDLDSVVIYDGGGVYIAERLAQGAHARARRSEDARPQGLLPPGLFSPLMEPAGPLLAAVLDGRVGEQRYVARASYRANPSALLHEQVDTAGSGPQWILGVY